MSPEGENRWAKLLGIAISSLNQAENDVTNSNNSIELLLRRTLQLQQYYQPV